MFADLITLLRWLYWTARRQEAAYLNLRLGVMPKWAWPAAKWRGQLIAERRYMAQIGQTFIATIAPTTAGGLPAPVTGVVWTVTDGYAVLSQAESGLSAVLQAKNAGTGNKVSVSAVSKAGITLTAEAVLADVEAPDEEAVALNLTVA